MSWNCCPDPPPIGWRGTWPDENCVFGKDWHLVPQRCVGPVTTRPPQERDGYFDSKNCTMQYLGGEWFALPNTKFDDGSPWYAWQPSTGKVCWMILQGGIWLLLSKSPWKQPTFKEEVQSKLWESAEPGSSNRSLHPEAMEEGSEEAKEGGKCTQGPEIDEGQGATPRDSASSRHHHPWQYP